MKKRILSFILAILLLFGTVPVTAQKAEAAVTYSVDKAMAYAKAHWNDGVGLCAEFVSKCVRAGGLNNKIMAGTGNCLREIERVSGLEHEVLKLNKSGYATKALNGDHLAAGDVVIQYCPNCQIRPHALFCAGYDSKGIAVFYAHNGAMNREYYRLSSVSTHPNCKNLEGWVIRLSTLDTSKQTDTVTFSNFSETSNTGNISVEYKISYTGKKPTTEGIIWGPSKSEMVHRTEYSVSTSNTTFNTSYAFMNLASNRTYYYQPYVIQNGKTVTGSVRSVTTAKFTKTLTITQDSSCGYKLTVNPNNEVYLYTSATASEAYDYLAPHTTTYTLYATRRVVLSNSTARYFCIDSSGNTAWVGYLTYQNGMALPETVHNYKDTVVKPTYTSEGYTLHQCACGNSYKDNYKPVLTKPTPTPATSAFTDVPQNEYYYTPVSWAVQNKITTGISNTTFSPEGICTRAQVVTFLWRNAGSPKVSASNPFTDVKKSDYYYDAVLWAVQKGITKGTSSTTFSPEQDCTRGQVVTFLYRAKNSPYVSGYKHSFNDINYLDYYYDAVLWAVKNNVTTGTSATTFSPNASCTRGQIVTFLYRAEN